MIDSIIVNRNEMDRLETGRKLRAVRKRRNLTVAQVAHYTQTTQQAVYNWECGKVDISLNHLVILCGFYAVDISEVICTKLESVILCNYDD